jgi:DNA-binding phage protein
VSKQMNDEGKQLNVWLPENLKIYLDERAKRENKHRKTIIIELLEQDRARQQGELVEQESLPLFREALQTEMRKFLALQRSNLQDDLDDLFQKIMSELEELVPPYILTRIAKLMTRAVRDGGINRHLLYSSLSKAHGPQFAEKAYDDAEKQVNEELARPKPKERKAE